MEEEGVRIPIGYRDISSHKLFANEPPNKLFHYTGLNGASGILESRSLWLTKLSYLNDKAELRLAIDLFRSEVDRILPSVGDNEKKEFLMKASHQLQSFSKINICVASFCENSDLLSQWRSYGNNGAGIALEFNANDLKNISNGMNLWKCVYAPREHKIVISDLIDILLRSYDVVAARKETSTDWETVKTDLLGYFNTTFLRVAPVIKNSHFHEEKEWRLITMPTQSTDKNWHARVSNERVAEYYKLDFNLIGSAQYEFISGAIIGPTREPNLVADAVWVLFRKNGFKHKHVANSQIPYRS
jgi:hypothetical protein